MAWEWMSRDSSGTALLTKDFAEEAHPRDEHGRFTDAGSSGPLRGDWSVSSETGVHTLVDSSGKPLGAAGADHYDGGFYAVPFEHGRISSHSSLEEAKAHLEAMLLPPTPKAVGEWTQHPTGDWHDLKDASGAHLGYVAKTEDGKYESFKSGADAPLGTHSTIGEAKAALEAGLRSPSTPVSEPRAPSGTWSEHTTGGWHDFTSAAGEHLGFIHLDDGAYKVYLAGKDDPHGSYKTLDAAKAAMEKALEDAAKDVAAPKSPILVPINRVLEAKVEQVRERAERAYASEHGMSVEEYRAAADKHLAEIVAKAVPATRAGESAFTGILSSGRFKSQFETGTSKGMLSSKYRSEAEEAMFGYPKDLSPVERPIYGYATIDSDFGMKNRTAEQYGSIIIRLKDDVRSRASITLTDSLGTHKYSELIPSPMTAPSRLSAGSNMDVLKMTTLDAGAYNYRELQYHGGLGVKDIQEVVFPSEARALKFSDRLSELGIPWRVVEV